MKEKRLWLQMREMIVSGCFQQVSNDQVVRGSIRPHGWDDGSETPTGTSHRQVSTRCLNSSHFNLKKVIKMHRLPPSCKNEANSYITAPVDKTSTRQQQDGPS
jgi:hypothetical protein